MEPTVAQGGHVMGPAVRIAVAVLAIAGCRGEHEGSGMITPARVPVQELTARGAAQTAAREQLGSPAPAPKQILFGDLKCIPRSPPTRSSAALPMLQGERASAGRRVRLRPLLLRARLLEQERAADRVQLLRHQRHVVRVQVRRLPSGAELLDERLIAPCTIAG